MSVNMLNCTSFTILDLSCLYLSHSNCPLPLSKFAYGSSAFVCMYEDQLKPFLEQWNYT